MDHAVRSVHYRPSVFMFIRKPRSDFYHITSKDEASEAQKTGISTPAAFAREGFIHCSYRLQVIKVANRIFRVAPSGAFGDHPAALDCRVIDENLEGGSELYPHVYGRPEDVGRSPAFILSPAITRESFPLRLPE